MENQPIRESPTSEVVEGVDILFPPWTCARSDQFLHCDFGHHFNMRLWIETPPASERCVYVNVGQVVDVNSSMFFICIPYSWSCKDGKAYFNISSFTANPSSEHLSNIIMVIQLPADPHPIPDGQTNIKSSSFCSFISPNTNVSYLSPKGESQSAVFLGLSVLQSWSPMTQVFTNKGLVKTLLRASQLTFFACHVWTQYCVLWQTLDIELFVSICLDWRNLFGWVVRCQYGRHVACQDHSSCPWVLIPLGFRTGRGKTQALAPAWVGTPKLWWRV